MWTIVIFKMSEEIEVKQIISMFLWNLIAGKNSVAEYLQFWSEKENIWNGRKILKPYLRITPQSVSPVSFSNF